jgi:glucose/arabinose dehydrogenase
VRLPDYPHSVAFRDGEILIACTEGLFRASYRPGQEQIPKASVERLASLPGGGGHSSRTVGVGPDGRIYVSLGIAGNCSDQYLGENYPFEDRRGGVFVLIEEKVRAPRWEPFAAGLRNPVGFAWQPGTGVLYASNNGPDHWGFELPPEAFSRLVPGSFHGMPWFQWDGKEIRRDACIRSEPPRPAADVSVPVATFPARSAPMGVAFVPKGALLSALEGDAVVAIHGSWATKPGGTFFGDPATRRPPAVDVVRFEGTGARRVDALVGGFQLSSGNRWARPVGVAFGSDGALYFSSDEGVEGILRLRPANAAPSLGPGGS